ncbi:hypothetical protein AAVH_25838 [Aphelenchoides avenae]|nr:hypothetical protein AAVH_25838 [Aphelenchus avenae]
MSETVLTEVFEIPVSTDYLRNLTEFPLPEGRSAEDANVQPGKCNNFNWRKNGGKPLFVVQHHTVADFSETVRIFTEKATSAHYVIDKDGTVQEFVDPNFRSYHAGKGSLSSDSLLLQGLIYEIPKDDMNSWSIGIENVNTGDEPFSEDQIWANIFLLQELHNRFPELDSKRMIGHADWALGRKNDPSPYFPWEQFANASDLYAGRISRNFGVYPRKSQLRLKENPKVIFSFDLYQQGNVSSEDLKKYRDLLRQLGYDIPPAEDGFGPKTEQAVFAFRIHYAGPEILASLGQREAWHGIAQNKGVGKNQRMISRLDENDALFIEDLLKQLNDAS